MWWCKIEGRLVLPPTDWETVSSRLFLNRRYWSFRSRLDKGRIVQRWEELCAPEGFEHGQSVQCSNHWATTLQSTVKCKGETALVEWGGVKRRGSRLALAVETSFVSWTARKLTGIRQLTSCILQSRIPHQPFRHLSLGWSWNISTRTKPWKQ